jgi:hypothetical protein
MGILEPGEKVLIIERRFFKEDIRHQIVGEVTGCTEYAVRVNGYVWNYDSLKGFTRKPEHREMVITFNKGLVISTIPKEVNLADVKYTSSLQKGHFVTDGKNFSLDISEFVSS